jgi:hypothetical protein
MSDRKHADLWRELVDEAGEAEIDRAASVSVADAEAELKAAGFDVPAERAKATAFIDAPGGEAASATPDETPPAPKATPPAPETPRRKRPRPVVVWLAAAATLVAAGAALYALDPGPDRVGSPPPPPTPTRPAPVPSADPLAVATELRRKAAAACDAKQWRACVAALDEARAIDPGGDGAPAVKALRAKAAAMGGAP